jgi:protein tyrosine kinase modulator
LEEDFDLRPFIEALQTSWKLILGVSFLTAFSAFLVSSFLPLDYQINAIVAYLEPDASFQFDDRIFENQISTPLKALPELAKSDEVIELVIESLPQTYELDREELKQQLTVKQGDDVSLIRFTANAEDPEKAAQLANVWAETFTVWANNLYSDQSGAQLQFFEDQLVQAEERLAVANQNFADFSEFNQTTIISNTLQIAQQEHIAELKSYNGFEKLSADAEALQSLIQSQAANRSVSYADQLSYLRLQLEAFGGENVPIFLQATSDLELSSISPESQIATLVSFREIMGQQLVETENNLKELETEILDLQQRLQESTSEESRLLREVRVANQTVTTLGFKVEEEKISTLNTNDGFRIVSHAAVPQNPIGPRRLFNTAIAGILGFSLSIFFIMIWVWWQDREPTTNMNNGSTPQ